MIKSILLLIISIILSIISIWNYYILRSINESSDTCKINQDNVKQGKIASLIILIFSLILMVVSSWLIFSSYKQ